MDVLDRYLAAIARELPKAQAADISAELRDTLMSQIEEREEALGRPLSPKEIEGVITGFGHPLVVAGRYRKIQHLIGPQVFPFWWATTRIVFGIAGAIYLAAVIVRAVASGGPSQSLVNEAQAGLWPLALLLFGGVTLTFAIFERVGPQFLTRSWSPRQLPPVRARSRGRFNVATEIVMGAVFLLWWTGVIHFRTLLPWPATLKVDLAPVWSEFYWPILAYSSVEVGINLLELLRPGWVRLGAALGMAKNATGCLILASVLRADQLLVVTAPTIRPAELAGLELTFNSGLRIGLTVTLIVLACKAAWDVWRLISGRSRGRIGSLSGAPG